ncbi:MAG: FAD-dependent monooxygenase [Bdellovibrionales bacterium]|nr:FAD-dependent monooxygenase [Bdellovibrionales bacterium]
MKLATDITILGASVAGAATALHLADLGIPSIIFDKSSEPKNKACGEGLSPIGVRELQRLGLAPGGTELPAYSLDAYRIHSPKGSWRQRVAEIPFRDTAGAVSGVGIERQDLQNALWSRLREHSLVTLLPGSPIKSVRSEGECYVTSSEAAQVRSRFIVLADGAHSKNSDRLGIPRKRIAGRARYGFSTHVSCSDTGFSHAVEVLLDRQFQAFLTPVGCRRANISVLGPRQTIGSLAHQGQRSAFLEQVGERFGVRLAHCADEEIFVTGPIGRFRRDPINGRALVVGDALEQLDPVGGMGMTFALASAAHAAQSLSRAGDEVESLACYRHDVERLARLLRGFTNLSYLSLARRPELPFHVPRRLASAVASSAHRAFSPGVPVGFSQLFLWCLGAFE